MPELIDGRYELLEVLASGGMATVWRARDTRLDRLVALKRPHPAPPDDPVHARIEREARAAASLSHPHLVTVYDAGRDEGGPYLVMELVEGPTLATVGSGLDPRRSVEIGSRLAEALAAVHAAGIVHRDVKPANVLMSERGPQLTDFGIALDGDPSGRLTGEGAVIATPSYASPEQLAGHPATPKSDVFSLGVIVYELVSGRLPFSGTDRRAPPASVGDPTLDAVLGRVLSADPEDRPDAAELAEALGGAAPTVTSMPEGGSTIPMAPIPQPTAGTSAPAAPPPGREPGRRPWALAGVAALAALVLAAVALSTGDADTSTETTTPPSTSPSTASTARPTTSVAPTPTPTTAAPPTTAPPDTSLAEGVAEARHALEEALTAPHPSEFSPGDARKLMDKADEAIAAAAEGKEKEAGKKLREIARAVDDKLQGEERQMALERLVALADVLGVSLADENGDDDGDEGDDGD